MKWKHRSTRSKDVSSASISYGKSWWMGSHGSTTDTANWLEQPVAIISGRQHSVIFGSYEKTVLTFFERTIFRCRLHRDTCMTCQITSIQPSIICPVCSIFRQALAATLQKALASAAAVEEASTDGHLVLARRWLHAAEGTTSMIWNCLIMIGPALQPNSSRGFPEIKTQEDPSSTAGGNKSPSHFPRGFFAPIGFAQPSCSGYGSRRQESQRCQRQRCQGELIWKLPYTAVAAEAFGTWQQWNGWQRHLRLLWSFHGLQSLDGMVSVNRYSCNRLLFVKLLSYLSYFHTHTWSELSLRILLWNASYVQRHQQSHDIRKLHT